jgi:hypothetical protein
MKKISLLTRKFINYNIKVNTTTSSYPVRKVTSTIPAPTDNKTESAQEISMLNHYPCLNVEG